ncbi:MAG: acyl-CoA thioesterase [Ferruginibacter sp.]|nr:acyl-CoA thioesterase [Ferruginibacter sp.]
MFSSTTPIRIHYALTDQMGVVYHGHYAQFHEIGRTEALRQLGVTYKDIEALGIIMVVVDIHTRFLLPARYDDLIIVKTTLREFPVGHKIVFYGEIFIADKLINTSTVTLYILEAKGMKKSVLPEYIKDKLQPFFNT